MPTNTDLPILGGSPRPPALTRGIKLELVCRHLVYCAKRVRGPCRKASWRRFTVPDGDEGKKTLGLSGRAEANANAGESGVPEYRCPTGGGRASSAWPRR